MRQPQQAGGDAVRQRVNLCLSKLSDRDTEAMAIAELDTMALSLSADSLPPFLSAISDSRPTDKTPLRRHPLRLLSLLSSHLPPSSLLPLLPRMLSAALRRLRDPDSSVRLALVDAVGSLASAAAAASHTPGDVSSAGTGGLGGVGIGSGAGVLLRPLADAIMHEQDAAAQGAAALALAAAVAAAPDLGPQMQRLLPRFIKLVRSSAFKAKPALIALLGAAAAAGGASAPALLGQLVPCLAEFLSNEDWATRKAAADALGEVAVAEGDMLGGLKATCLATFESRRFDKVKNVRDSMNRMLELWKEIPGEAHSKETTSNGSSLSVKSASPLVSKKSKFVESRSSPPASRKNATPSSNIRSARTRAKPLFCKTDSTRNSDWTVDVAVPQTPPVEERVFETKGVELGENRSNARMKLEVKRTLFGKNGEDKVGKLAGLKSASRVVPLKESGSSESIGDGGGDELNAGHKDGDLSVIRMQLVQIENQQSSLLELLQRFIGSSQNGLHSLETRVHGLEIALDEISRATSYGRLSNGDPADMSCCRLPGTEFLSSKFWRRTEGRYSSRYSISGDPSLADTNIFAGKQGPQSYKWDTQRFGLQGGFVNPLAELSSQSRGNAEVTPRQTLRSAIRNSGIKHTQDG